MSSNVKSLFSLRNWLIYAEVLAVVGFVVLASLYIRRGIAEPESPPLSQVGAFIEKADARFAQEDLVDAALLYWRALQALETAEKEQIVSVNGGVPDKHGGRFARESPHRGNLFTEQLAERCEGTLGACSTYSTGSSRCASLAR